MNKPGKRGSVAVEAALMLSMLLGVGFLAADMHRVSIERTRLEGTASSAALNISAQPMLTKHGLDALSDVIMQGHTEMQQMIIMNVLQSGRINWSLTRGGATDLCEADSEGGYYNGELPEDPPEEETENEGAGESPDTVSFVVVQACRSTADISSYGGIVIPQILRVDSVYRANARKIDLDEQLQEENQEKSDTEQEE